MKLSEQRIRMMNLQLHDKYKVSVRDLHQPDGSAAGTEVVLELPQTNN